MFCIEFLNIKIVVYKNLAYLCTNIDFIYITTLFFTPALVMFLHNKHFCYWHISLRIAAHSVCILLLLLLLFIR